MTVIDPVERVIAQDTSRVLPQHFMVPRLQLSQRLALLLRVMILTGYPLVGILVAYFGLQSSTLTVPFRIVVLALSVLVILTALQKRHRERIPALLVVFFLIYTLRLCYDLVFVNAAGAGTALVYFLALVFIPVTASMLAGTAALQDTIFARWLLIMALATTALTLISNKLGLGYNPWDYAGEESVRLGFKALNPISLGNIAGICIISSTYLLLGTHQGRAIRFAAWLGLPMAAMVLLLANSRGPVIAVAFALLWFMARKSRRIIYALPFALILFLLVPLDNILILNVADRFSGPFMEDAAIAGRLLAQGEALQAFFKYPFFGAHYIDPNLGPGNYPHNLLIETAMALGMVGLTLFLAMLWMAIAKSVSYVDVKHPFIVMLMAQQFIMAQLSGALWASDSFFLLLSLTLAAKRLPANANKLQ